MQLLQILLASVLQVLFLFERSEEEEENGLEMESDDENVLTLLRLTNTFCGALLTPTPSTDDSEIRQNAVYSLCMICRQLCKLISISYAANVASWWTNSFPR